MEAVKKMFTLINAFLLILKQKVGKQITYLEQNIVGRFKMLFFHFPSDSGFFSYLKTI